MENFKERSLSLLNNKKKFLSPKCLQPLTETQKKQRMKFCRWLLEQPNPENVVLNVTWTDEKYFWLHQKPRTGNGGIWVLENPHEFVETNNRNDLKVMMLVPIVDGKIPIVHVFIDDDRRQVSVNGSCYLNHTQGSSFCNSKKLVVDTGRCSGALHS